MTRVRALEWEDGKVRFLDQTRLPSEERYVETDDPLVIGEAIKTLAIRGAPLIGIAAAYAVALAAGKCRATTPPDITSYYDKVINLLAGTRPTAVNLFWALNRQSKIVAQYAHGSHQDLHQSILREARAIQEEDDAMCAMIGTLGAELLPNAASVLTHCNTGSLATGGIGTALGIIRTSWDQHKLKHVYVDETRPLLQGARLTAWELNRDGIPSTLITDNVAGFLMQQGKVNAVVVGADRIARNGDVANKVGTYTVAVLARHHGIPMVVAAPTSTIDFETSDGRAIPIEQRHANEVTRPFGNRIAPEGTEVYAPAFDITPADFVSAIVTERGVVRQPYQQSLDSLRKTAETT